MGNISSSVMKYVELNDTKSVRIALTTIGYIADYDSFEQFKTSTEYANAHLDDLFELDNDEVIDSSVSEDTYKKIMKQLMNNFSEKKYKALIQCGTKIFKKNYQKIEPNTKEIKGMSSKKKEELDPFLTKETTTVQDVLDWIIRNPIIVLVIIVVLAVLMVLLFN